MVARIRYIQTYLIISNCKKIPLYICKYLYGKIKSNIMQMSQFS